MPAPSSNHAWLAQVVEDALEPELPICDPHHHLWEFRHERVAHRYLLDEILEDVNAGHNIVSTVFIECGAMFRRDGPEHLRPGGETEFLHQGLKIQPERGKLILFPPFWTHEHRGVTLHAGVKYIATTWVCFA